MKEDEKIEEIVDENKSNEVQVEEMIDENNEDKIEENVVEENSPIEVAETVVIDEKAQEEKVETIKFEPPSLPPKHFLIMNLQRTGEIFSNLAILATVVISLACIGLVIFPLAVVLNYLLAIIVVFFTLGTILVAPGWHFNDLILFNFKDVDIYREFVSNALPYALYVAIGLSAISIIALAFNTKKLSIGRIVASSIFIAAAVVTILFLATI